MKLLKIVLLSSLVIALLTIAAPLTTASAAGLAKTVTVTITQDQINSSYWVTNPPNRSISNRSVTLGDGVVTLTQTVTLSSGKVFDTVSTWAPRISARSHDIYWVLQSATVNGTPAPQSVINAINYNDARILRNLVRAIVSQYYHGYYKFDAVSISPAGIVVTISF